MPALTRRGQALLGILGGVGLGGLTAAALGALVIGVQERTGIQLEIPRGVSVSATIMFTLGAVRLLVSIVRNGHGKAAAAGAVDGQALRDLGDRLEERDKELAAKLDAVKDELSEMWRLIGGDKHKTLDTRITEAISVAATRAGVLTGDLQNRYTEQHAALRTLVKDQSDALHRRISDVKDQIDDVCDRVTVLERGA